MRVPTVQTSGTTGSPREDLVIKAEELALEPERGGTMGGISRALGTSIGTRFWRIAALGALLVGAASLYISISQGEADSRTASKLAGNVSPASLILTPADQDLAELPYDELTRNFFGASSASSTGAGYIEPDLAELPYDELTRNFFGVSSAGSTGAGFTEQDLAELPYDEMSRNFFSISSPGSADAGFTEQDLAELPYDEMSRNFFSVPVTSK